MMLSVSQADSLANIQNGAIWNPVTLYARSRHTVHVMYAVASEQRCITSLGNLTGPGQYIGLNCGRWQFHECVNHEVKKL